jgi:dihydropteroate synthase
MGVLNVTPDSFSDGGRWLDVDAAVAHGLALATSGADLVDVGGESTRPGADPVDAALERQRVEPVIARLAAEGVAVSVDTTKASVARSALDAGAVVVNDISAGRNDPDLVPLVAERGAGFVAMHMLGEPRTMQDAPAYEDVVREVGEFLAERVAAAEAAGVARASVAVDPGIGFGKTSDHNLELLARLDVLVARFAVPMVIGTSRKRFIARVLADVGGVVGEPTTEDRDDGTLATTVWAVEQGVRVVRVHDARAAARAITLLEAMRTVEAA